MYIYVYVFYIYVVHKNSCLVSDSCVFTDKLVMFSDRIWLPGKWRWRWERTPPLNVFFFLFFFSSFFSSFLIGGQRGRRWECTPASIILVWLTCFCRCLADKVFFILFWHWHFDIDHNSFYSRWKVATFLGQLHSQMCWYFSSLLFQFLWPFQGKMAIWQKILH